MVATQFFIMGMGLVDTVMAGRYSAADLAGVAIGGSLLWPLFMFMTGLTMALTPIVSQLRGACIVEQSGVRVRQGLWLATVASVVTAIAVYFGGSLLSLAGIDATALSIADGYLKAISWGVVPGILYVALRQVCEGLGQTRPPMFIAGSALLMNIFFNYLFVYGFAGFEGMGGVGCGWATTIVWWIELGLMVFVVRMPFYGKSQTFSQWAWPDAGEIAKILRIGVPVALTIFLEMSLFSVITLLIGRLGINEVAAHTVAGNLNWASYVIPMSIGAAASIRVGYFVGAGDHKAARRTAAVALGLSLAYAVIVSLIMILGRHYLVAIYTNDIAVAQLAATLLLFIAFYQLFDDTQATMIGALRGYKDTFAPMIISLCCYWIIGLPLGHLLASGQLGFPALGVYGYWIGITLGLAIVALCVAVRLWRTSRNEALILKLASA